MANEVIDTDEKNDPPQQRIKIDGHGSAVVTLR